MSVSTDLCLLSSQLSVYYTVYWPTNMRAFYYNYYFIGASSGRSSSIFKNKSKYQGYYNHF